MPHAKRTTESNGARRLRLILQQLGDFVSTERKRQGLLQKELADRAGINARYLSRIERGRINISFVLLVGLVQALGVCTVCLPLARHGRSTPHVLCGVIQDCVATGKKRELAALLASAKRRLGPDYKPAVRVCPFLCMKKFPEA